MEIKALIDEGLYFTINRARQYGKTITLRALVQYLQKDYCVVSIDFQTFSHAEFADEYRFALSFAESFLHMLKRSSSVNSGGFQEKADELKKLTEQRNSYFTLRSLFMRLGDLCATSDKPMVLMIDETDSASAYPVFLDFLAQLRAYYMDRDIHAAFHSVILAGVYDIRNLKRKLRPEDEHKVNSPWNIASDFN